VLSAVCVSLSERLTRLERADVWTGLALGIDDGLLCINHIAGGQTPKEIFFFAESACLSLSLCITFFTTACITHHCLSAYYQIYQWCL